jgi:pyruvate dehydrogenase E1 component alpha subunit
MPERKLVTFSVRHLQILDHEGKVDRKLEPKLPEELLWSMYRQMVLCRVFDDKAVKLQRQGRMGTYGPLLGQEATQVGSALALQPQDWAYMTYRENGAYITRGMPMRSLFLYWMGNEEGMRIPEGLNCLPLEITVGSQISHAAGTGWAMNVLKERNKAVLAYFGDGASSQGDFHDGLNFAGVFKAPCVFLCSNNQWAISVPRKLQTAAESIAQRAYGYGFEGVQVDGNDVLAVYTATRDALEKARKGGGPTLIECVTYRMSMHTTADDPTRYRDEKEVKYWADRDPIKRFRAYLEKKGIWSRKKEDALQRECEELVAKAVEEAEAAPPPTAEDMFRYVNAKMTPDMEEQLDDLKTALKEGK